MSDKMSVAQSFELDKYLPGDDMFSDPRWVSEEIAPGLFMWTWNPAEITYLNGAYVATVGAKIERFPALDAAEWWCSEIMDVQPVINVPGFAFEPAALVAFSPLAVA